MHSCRFDQEPAALIHRYIRTTGNGKKVSHSWEDDLYNLDTTHVEVCDGYSLPTRWTVAKELAGSELDYHLEDALW
jgi:hypothetical protein